MFRRVVPFELLSKAARLCWLKTFVKTGWTVNVQIIHDEHNRLGVGIDNVSQLAQDVGEVQLRAALMHPDLTKAGQRFHRQEDRALAMPRIFVVLAPRLSRLQRQRASRRRAQRLLNLVEADLWTPRVIRSLINGQDVFHLSHKARRWFGKAPGLHAPRLKFIFFNASPTATWLMDSTNSRTTKRSANRRNVQRSYSSGGSLHTIATRWASTSPVIFGLAPGRGFSLNASSRPPAK